MGQIMTSPLFEIEAFLPISFSISTSGQPTTKQFSNIAIAKKMLNCESRW
jgi:hypothetical protein